MTHRRGKNLFVLFFLCLFFNFQFQLAAGQLHVLLVGDTAASELKASINVDLQTIENHALDITRFTGLSPKIQRITAQNARAEQVLKLLHNLETVADDAVLFYFSGHGYRTPSKEGNQWPNIYFATDQTGIDLFEIATILKGKSAHFTLVVADCCNSSLPNHLAPPVAKGHHKPSANDEKTKRNFQKLFLEAQGQVLIASSKAGQPSWSISKAGSLYTNAYSDTFKFFIKQAQTDLLDWQSVLDQASYKTHQIATKNGIAQDPIYLVR